MPKIRPDGTPVQAPNLALLPKTEGKRLCANWLASFLDHTAELESPHIYLLWSGLSAIAAVAQRKIYRETQAYTVYPNLYVWLVGPPGTKKSTAIRAGKRLLTPKGVSLPGVYFSSDAPSIPGIMDDYKDVAAVQKDNQTLNAFMWELGTLFENAPETMTGFLTAIYDGDANYVKKTRMGGKEHIPYPLLNLIGGTTPRWLGDNLSKNAVEGGLVARTIPVFSDELSFDAPEPEISPDFLKRESLLTHDLAHILQRSGHFEWEGGRTRHDGPCVPGCGCGDAFVWYDKWYRDRSRIPRIQDNRTQSYYVRKPIHILKVAMLLSLAESDNLTFTVESLIQAKAMLEKIEGGMKHAFSAVGSNPFATDLERIHIQIKQSGGLSKAEIIAANYHNIDQQKLEMTLKSLEDLQYVTKVIRETGIFYLPVSSGGE